MSILHAHSGILKRPRTEPSLTGDLPPPQTVIMAARPIVAIVAALPVFATTASAFVAPRVGASFGMAATCRAHAFTPIRMMASANQAKTGFSINARPAPGNPFHLAFPVRDIEESRKFYGDILGCTQGRIGEPQHQTLRHKPSTSNFSS